MSSNSSSSEDEFENIKEAVDDSFLTEDLYSNGKLKNNCKSQPSPLPSLRRQNHETISINPFSIKVTPEYQLYVSKHLSRLLDELIDDSEIIFRAKKFKPSCLDSGVKLLCSSKGYLQFSGSSQAQIKPRKLVKETLDTNIYVERAKEVAVSPEWVLSQEETRHWVPCKRGEIEILKLEVCNNKDFHKKKRKKKPKFDGT